MLGASEMDKCEESCIGTMSDAVETVKERMISEDTSDAAADIFKALGDATRVKMIYALMQQELCVHDLTQVLDMGQSAVSHQLRYLRNLRIVKRRKEGKIVFYSLDDDHIEQILRLTLRHLEHA